MYDPNVLEPPWPPSPPPARLLVAPVPAVPPVPSVTVSVALKEAVANFIVISAPPPPPHPPELFELLAFVPPPPPPPDPTRMTSVTSGEPLGFVHVCEPAVDQVCTSMADGPEPPPPEVPQLNACVDVS